jgi:NADH-quinone oxidoreductase subunit L
MLALVSVATAALGFLVAWFLYIKNPGSSTAIAQRFKPLYTLVENKFYIDEFYNAILVQPILMLSNLGLSVFDFVIVNGIPAGTAAGVRGLGGLTRRMQSGNIRSYAGWLALGAAAVVVVMIFGRSLWVHF